MDILRYQTASGRDVIGQWLADLADVTTRARIAARLARLAVGNFGDCKPLREGIWELRLDLGPGYRVYYAMAGRTCLLLLCGGDKRSQASDIQRASMYLKDYKQRTARP